MPRTKAKVELTPEQLEKLLRKLYRKYPTLLKNVRFEPGFEQICSMISHEIVNYLRTELGIDADYVSGKYRGRGTEFSGGRGGTYHCWVELFVRIRQLSRKPFRLIIDGAYAQFFPMDLTPTFVRDRMRLTIFVKDKTAEKWYEGSPDKFTAENYPLKKKKKRTT